MTSIWKGAGAVGAVALLLIAIAALVHEAATVRAQGWENGHRRGGGNWDSNGWRENGSGRRGAQPVPPSPSPYDATLPGRRRAAEPYDGQAGASPGGAPSPDEANARSMTGRERYCMQLEKDLAREWNMSNRSHESLPKLRENIQKQDRIYQLSRSRAERANCYEYFLFSKTVRRTRHCLRLDRKIEDARRVLARFQAELQSITSARSDSGRRDELISALARNGCGERYSREARRRSRSLFSFWSNEEDTGSTAYGGLERQKGILPFATYRTMCVRLCDGYYFPVSFSTLPSKFGKDASVCQSKCAAPVELFVYQNPGGNVDRMVSITGRPYTEIQNAWRYRKEFVKGCSCKRTEYRAGNDGEVGAGAPTVAPGAGGTHAGDSNRPARRGSAPRPGANPFHDEDGKTSTDKKDGDGAERTSSATRMPSAGRVSAVTK